MKLSSINRSKRGYVSLVLVLSVGAILSLLAVAAYRGAMNAQAVQSQVQLRVDYSEKEGAILRSIVAITPNRAIRAMQSGSDADAASRNPLTWQSIFREALVTANARTSIDARVVADLNITNLRRGNTGDSGLATVSRIFAAVPPGTGFVAEGINRTLGTGYPPPLTSTHTTTSTRDRLYPIISRLKTYGALAQSDLNSATLNGDGVVGYGVPVASYPSFNRLAYPEINFGYARPGTPFVAKRNWWAFSLGVADHDANLTSLASVRRNFVLSIYEVPSQLAITADAFMSFGQYADGGAWQNVAIDGPVFAGRAEVRGNLNIPSLTGLSARRGIEIDDTASATIGGKTYTSNDNHFAVGARETHQVTTGEFLPVSLASDSGHAAFVPINRGEGFFDRFAHAAPAMAVSTTDWDNYSVGALQCAMRLDVIQTLSSVDMTPTNFRFSYLMPNGARAEQFLIPVNDATTPFATITLPGGEPCVVIYPKRLPAYLASIGAGTTTLNHSLVVNVDYSISGLNTPTLRPLTVPLTLADGTDNPANIDPGLVMKECADLSGFPRGFSLVTNLRLYIGDDFNTTAIAAPAGYTLPGPYYPPCSVFAPEKRYGVEVNPFSIVVSGQIGSLADQNATTAVRPLDSKNMSGNTIGAGSIQMNLRAITDPADLPPITMMNWLITLEERNN